VFPTLGQRFGQSGFAGRTINTAEQAMQSMPGLGSLVTRARDIPRDAAQLGAFNESLKELAPFDPVLGQQVSRLPDRDAARDRAARFHDQGVRPGLRSRRSGMQFVPDAQYIADHKAFTGVLNSGVLDANQAAQVQKVINTASARACRVGRRDERGRLQAGLERRGPRDRYLVAQSEHAADGQCAVGLSDDLRRGAAGTATPKR
jgi:hypothetical protein